MIKNSINSNYMCFIFKLMLAYHCRQLLIPLKHIAVLAIIHGKYDKMVLAPKCLLAMIITTDTDLNDSLHQNVVIDQKWKGSRISNFPLIAEISPVI